MPLPLLVFDHVAVRHTHRILFPDLSFRIEHGQQWALVGESGAGKSALLAALAGRLGLGGGQAAYPALEAAAAPLVAADPLFTWRRLVAHVGARADFRTLSNTTELYYQQRFNATDVDQVPTVRAYLAAIRPAGAAPTWMYARTVERLHLTHLQEQRLLKLSNGETKRLRLAAALLQNPRLLLLDTPLAGLDASARAAFDALLHDIIQSGISVVLSTTPHELPAGITHVAVLRHGAVVAAGAKAQFQPAQPVAPTVLPSLDEAELRALLALTPSPPAFTTIVGLENVTVRYGGKTVLDGVSWQVKPGERWALTGPNGAGKSTLLSLLNGDNPQAYGQHITLFDRRRGSGESIWDLKRNIGFVSPELFQYFPARQSCAQIVESGYSETLGLLRPSQPENATVARHWLRLLGVGEHAAAPFRTVPASVQRLCLLARALVRNPPLYLFDEPCQGLYAHQQRHFRHVLDSICQASPVTLIYVSHYPAEIPASVTQVLRLEQGRRVEQ